jgi:hypothetical protein
MTTSTTPRSTVTSPDATAQLEQAVQRAVAEDHRLSVEALWTNRVPANPPASGGPELAILRRSVAERRKAGVRVRTLSERFRIVGVRLDPSYTTATATVIDTERVQPTDLNGRPRGRPSATAEHVHLELRRLGASQRFLVWKVTLLK